MNSISEKLEVLGKQIYDYSNGDISVAVMTQFTKTDPVSMLIISGSFWTRYLVLSYSDELFLKFEVLDIMEGSKSPDKVDVKKVVNEVFWILAEDIETNYSAIYRTAHPQKT